MDGPAATDTPKRDVKNHLLFEVATEVANRGEHYENQSRAFC